MKKLNVSSHQKHASRRRREAIDRSKAYDHTWRKTSQRIRQQKPFCVECLKQGKYNATDTQVDHIIPLEVAPELKYVESNLQVLCRPSGHIL